MPKKQSKNSQLIGSLIMGLGILCLLQGAFLTGVLVERELMPKECDKQQVTQ